MRNSFVHECSKALWLSLAGNGAIAADLWSSLTTWQGQVPRPGEVATIPPGRDVLLDADSPDLASLVVRGRLTFAEEDLRLTSRWILIDGGTLQIGTEDSPHAHVASITLTGTNATENIAGEGPRRMGTKFIGVMNGGRLELHGARARTRNWTQLGGNATVGSTQLQLADPMQWTTGDRMAIAPNGFDPEEAEEVTVTSVMGSVIHFTPSLQRDLLGCRCQPRPDRGHRSGRFPRKDLRGDGEPRSRTGGWR